MTVGRVARLASALALLAGCNGEPTTPGPVPQPSLQASIAQGKADYDRYCALCHGENGVGYAADNANALANQDFLAAVTDRHLTIAITRGRPGTAMAGYGQQQGGPLEATQVRDIVRYLRSLQTEPALKLDQVAVTGDAKRAEPIYAKHCASCHGPRGEGTGAMSLNNPLFLVSASDGFIRHAIEKGRRGTPMAAYGDRLTTQDLDDLTALIRSWARTVVDDPSGEPPPAFARVVINETGPPAELGPLREGRFVPAKRVKEAMEGGKRLILLDARTSSDWLRAHIPGSVPFPYYNAHNMMGALPRDGTWIVAYCGCPHAASGQVMDLLRDRGFENTAVLDEGFFVWMQLGYPVTVGRKD